MNIPDAAIEAAAERLYQFNEWGIDSNGDYYKDQVPWDSIGDSGQEVYRREASAAIPAAMPAIREALSQEIEAGAYDPVLYRVAKALIADAARIVRGGDPS